MGVRWHKRGVPSGADFAPYFRPACKELQTKDERLDHFLYSILLFPNFQVA
jgi:hypothetical protein